MVTVNQLLVSMISLLPKRLVKRFAMRYIAGETLDDAIEVVKYLNSKNMMATVDVLGENVSTKEESLLSVRMEEDVLRSMSENRFNANVSVKLTQLGLKIDQSFCHSNARYLLEVARANNNFLRIDMEDSSTTSATLRLYERLRSDGYENVGIVIQANMRRSEEDIQRLIPLKANVRLCKGAYLEPEEIAFKNREEVRLNYLRLLKLLLQGRCYVGIATHDDLLIRGAYQAIQETNLQKTDYEFQMLHGVRAKLRDQIVAEGHRLRVYVPFGQHWYPYSIRRFKENPQIVRYVIRALFRKDS